MVGEIMNTTLSPGETQDTGYFPLSDKAKHHTLFSLLTGGGYVSAVAYTSPRPDDACDVLDETIYSNEGEGKKRHQVAFDPAPFGKIVVTNDSGADVAVRLWLVQV